MKTPSTSTSHFVPLELEHPNEGYLGDCYDHFFLCNMEVGCRNVIVAFGAIITTMGKVIGCCIILIKFGEDYFIFNGGCWGISLDKR